MNKYFLATAIAVCSASVSYAQHSDIEFGLDDLANPTTVTIPVEEESVTNQDGASVFESSFMALDFTGTSPDFFSDQPGFITAGGEGLLLNEGDSVSVRLLDAGDTANSNFGAGFVSFFDGTAGSALQASGALEITNQDGDSITLDGGSTTGETILLGVGDDGTGFSTPPTSTGEAPEPLGVGELHNHLVFDLLNDGTAPVGAYGILAQFEVDLADGGTPDGTADVFSNPFFLIFNRGLDEEVFETQALAAFGVSAVPEPASGVILVAAGVAVAARRRRRR